MPIRSRSNSYAHSLDLVSHRLAPNRKGAWFKIPVMSAVVATMTLVATAGCTGHSDANGDSTASMAAATGAERSLASAETAKSNVDESLGNSAKATTKGKHKVKTSHTASVKTKKTDATVYVVQIGAFRVKDNAEKLNQKLKSQGYPVVLQTLAHSSNGQLFLVRFNPMSDRKEAEDMRLNLKAKADVDSMILALPKADREVSSTSSTAEAKNTDVNSASSN